MHASKLQVMPALQVAIALGLLTAEVSAPPFNQLVCTFSEEPQLHHIKEGSLVDKVGWQGLGLSTEPALRAAHRGFAGEALHV